MADPVTDYFSQQGILGIIIIMLMGVIVWQQWRIDGKDTRINELQDKRKTDTDVYTKSYTDVVKEQIATQKDIVHAQTLIQKSLDSMALALNSLVNGGK